MVDRQEILAVVDALLELWENRVQEPVQRAKLRRRRGTRGGPVGAPTISAVLALTAYQYSAVGRLRTHLGGRLLPPDYATVRAVFEAALTTIWLAKEPEAINAWIREMSRNRTNLEKNAVKSTQFKALVGNMDTLASATEDISVSKELAAEARHVEQLAERVAFADAYVLYRLLCEKTHPTVGLADDYLSMTDEGGFAFHPGADSGPDGSDGWIYLMAACLLWCARLLNHWDSPEATRTARRSELRNLASQLEIPLEIGLRARMPEKH